MWRQQNLWLAYIWYKYIFIIYVLYVLYFPNMITYVLISILFFFQICFLLSFCNHIDIFSTSHFAVWLRYSLREAIAWNNWHFCRFQNSVLYFLLCFLCGIRFQYHIFLPFIIANLHIYGFTFKQLFNIFVVLFLSRWMLQSDLHSKFTISCNTTEMCITKIDCECAFCL